MWYYWTGAREQKPVAAAPVPPPFVKLVDGQGTTDRVLIERAEYFDPTPLFIPTDKNYGQGPLPAWVVPQPGQIFGDIPANLTVNENNLANYAGGYQSEAESLLDLLARGNEAPFAGFGRVDSPLHALPARAGFIEVKALSTGNLVISESIPDGALQRSDFVPVEFLTVVNSAGLVGEPMLTAGSGREEVDSAIRDFLVKTYRLGDRLAPGQYVVSVGP
jgi:hypothetical protein